MFFVSKKLKNGKIGVVDTNDWVEEFITTDELMDYRKMDVVIESQDVQLEILRFFSRYSHLSGEMGGSSLDLVDGYICGEYEFREIAYEFGSSTGDMVRSAKPMYDELKKKWKEFKVSELGCIKGGSKIYADYCEIKNMEYNYSISREQRKENMILLIEDFCKTYHFSKKIVSDDMLMYV